MQGEFIVHENTTPLPTSRRAAPSASRRRVRIGTLKRKSPPGRSQPRAPQ